MPAWIVLPLSSPRLKEVIVADARRQFGDATVPYCPARPLSERLLAWAVLFCVESPSVLKVTTHEKYLLDPKLALVLMRITF
jgi:hypothetical protein